MVLVEDGSMGMDLTVRRLMQKKGYHRFMTTGCNDWYAPISNNRVINPETVRNDRIRVGLCQILGMLGRVGARIS